LMALHLWLHLLHLHLLSNSSQYTDKSVECYSS